MAFSWMYLVVTNFVIWATYFKILGEFLLVKALNEKKPQNKLNKYGYLYDLFIN